MDWAKFWRTLGVLIAVMAVLGGYAAVLTWCLYTFPFGILIVAAGFLLPLLIAVAATAAGWQPDLPEW